MDETMVNRTTGFNAGSFAAGVHFLQFFRCHLQGDMQIKIMLFLEAKGLQRRFKKRQ